MNKKYVLYQLILSTLLYSCATISKNYTPTKKYPKEKLQEDYILLKNILQKKHPSLYWYTSKDSMDMYFDKYYATIEDSMTEQQFGWNPGACACACAHPGASTRIHHRHHGDGKPRPIYRGSRSQRSGRGPGHRGRPRWR